MPESKTQAFRRALKLGFKPSQVTKGDKGYYLAPKGVESKAGKSAYVSCRDSGGSAEKCAKIAHTVNKK